MAVSNTLFNPLVTPQAASQLGTFTDGVLATPAAPLSTASSASSGWVSADTKIPVSDNIPVMSTKNIGSDAWVSGELFRLQKLRASGVAPQFDPTTNGVDAGAWKFSQHLRMDGTGQNGRDALIQQKDRERIKAYADILNGKSVDTTTQNEIRNMYDSGVSAASLTDYYNKALEGGGVFGLRTINQNTYNTQQSLNKQAKRAGVL